MTRALLPHPAEKAEQRYCTHVDCRLTAFEEMHFLAAEFSRPEIAASAHECLLPTVQVVCRRTPRKGPMRAPLPPRADDGHSLCEGT